MRGESYTILSSRKTVFSCGVSARRLAGGSAVPQIAHVHSVKLKTLQTQLHATNVTTNLMSRPCIKVPLTWKTMKIHCGAN